MIPSGFSPPHRFPILLLVQPLVVIEIQAIHHSYSLPLITYLPKYVVSSTRLYNLGGCATRLSTTYLSVDTVVV